MGRGHKILYIHHGGGLGGAPVSMLQLAAGLDRDRFEPLAVFTQEGPVLKYARELGVPARIVPMRSAFFYSTLAPLSLRTLWPFFRYYWRTVRLAKNLVEAVKPDLVHLNTSVLVPAAVGTKQTGTPIVWHVREPAGPNTILRHWHVARIQSLSDYIVTNSKYVARDYVGPKPVAVIHNALDKGRFSPGGDEVRKRVRAELDLPVEAPVVGIIGTAQAIKGHYFLVEAAPLVVKNTPGVRFLVVAGGVGEDYARTAKGRVKRLLGLPLDNLDRMRRLVRELGLNRHFVYSGFTTEIPEMIVAMDLLVFPSLVPEGFGRPLIEAMAMGCPVVATEIGPTREVVGDHSAVLVRPGDVQGLADAIVDVLRHPEKAKRLGDTGRCRFLKQFEMTSMQTKLRGVYHQVLRGRRV
ncbi:glycosyltransferase [Acidobacteria bacterium AH-259-A15]|nr:glycosyltransferase [Acidobacteria bacterium AH-259-A15]